jgi:high-affinity nickel-transport protein
MAGTVARIRGALTGREWARMGGMAGFIAALHIVGWFTLIAIIAPAHYTIGTQVFGAGTGVLAYTLGMRHAFDADHIAAIDNTTRKLMADGQRPLSVGFWFSLGHSSVVFGLCALLSVGIRSLAGQVQNSASALQTWAGLIGTGVSGTFLMLIAVLNAVVLWQILKVFRQMRTGVFNEVELEEHLAKRGLMNRILAPVMRMVTKPWQMYLVGLLFGLGFDTATEVSLLVLAGGASAFALPWYAILVLPVLFAAGMSLLDTVDGSFMNFAYEWAFSQPVRKVYYNITITALSVIVAVLIGGIEITQLVSQRLKITGGPIGWVAALDLNNVGYAIVGLFVATWAVALLVWRYARVEEKWSGNLRAADGTEAPVPAPSVTV